MIYLCVLNRSVTPADVHGCQALCQIGVLRSSTSLAEKSL
jgi:hypothetical protein